MELLSFPSNIHEMSLIGRISVEQLKMRNRVLSGGLENHHRGEGGRLDLMWFRYISQLYGKSRQAPHDYILVPPPRGQLDSQELAHLLSSLYG